MGVSMISGIVAAMSAEAIIIIVVVAAGVVAGAVYGGVEFYRKKKNREANARAEETADEATTDGQSAVAEPQEGRTVSEFIEMRGAQVDAEELQEGVIWLNQSEEPATDAAFAGQPAEPVQVPADVVYVTKEDEPAEEKEEESDEGAAEETAEELAQESEEYAQAEVAPEEEPTATEEPGETEEAAEEYDEDLWETDPELTYDESEEYYDEPETEEERLAEAAEEQGEAPAAVRIAEGEGDNVRYIIKKYQKGFMARLIQSEDIVKKYYTEIKNELLSYEGVKSREAWNHESFSAGRTMLAKISIRGKTLALYVALDPKQVIAEGRYAVDDMSGVGAHASTPTLYRIRNNRRLGGSKQLIKSAMKGREQNEKYRPVNWLRRLPYEDNDALAERGLVKVTVEEEK